MWSSIESSDILWGLASPFIGPVLTFIIGIGIFSYLLSIGKKKLGIYIGTLLTVVAVVWLVVNFVS